jgi:hypothetical protein
MNKKFFVIAALGLTLGGCNAVVYETGHRRPVASVYAHTTPVYIPRRPHYVHHYTYNPYVYRPLHPHRYYYR